MDAMYGSGDKETKWKLKKGRQSESLLDKVA